MQPLNLRNHNGSRERLCTMFLVTADANEHLVATCHVNESDRDNLIAREIFTHEIWGLVRWTEA